MRLFLLSVWCAAALAAVPDIPSTVGPKSIELSPSVQLVGKYDWEMLRTDNGPWSRCLDMVWRAVEAGSSRINFVPTHHWLPFEGQPNSIADFCYMDSVVPSSEATDGKNEYKCFPWSQARIQEYTTAMTICFAEALRQGLTVYIRPHLDDGTLQGAWRNGLVMEPTTRYGNFSYFDIMLAPLADAMREAITITAAEQTIKPPPGGTKPTVYFAVQGEMSATIMRFAEAWGKLMPRLRERIAGNNAGSVDIKMGVGLNFNRLDDTTSVDQQWGSSRLSWLGWQMGVDEKRDGVPQIDVDALKRLFTQELDFLGISAYAPYNLQGSSIPLKEFENSAFILCKEMLDSYDIDIKSLANSGKLELQYSEFGIGGGSSYAGNQVARNPSEVALRPFFGVYGQYTESKDPWSVSANRAFRESFYYRALEWLADYKTKTHKISGVFIWSMASWDVLGVYPESTNKEGSYRDADVIAAAQAYNTAVRAARSAQLVDSSTQPEQQQQQQQQQQQAEAAASPTGTLAVRVREPTITGPDGMQVMPASG